MTRVEGTVPSQGEGRKSLAYIYPKYWGMGSFLLLFCIQQQGG